MGKRGRPRSSRAASALTIHTKLRLYPGEDDDLIAFFDGIPHGLRATMVKLALRTGTAGEHSRSAPVDGDLLDALDALVG